MTLLSYNLDKKDKSNIRYTTYDYTIWYKY